MPPRMTVDLILPQVFREGERIDHRKLSLQTESTVHCKPWTRLWRFSKRQLRNVSPQILHCRPQSQWIPAFRSQSDPHFGSALGIPVLTKQILNHLQLLQVWWWWSTLKLISPTSKMFNKVFCPPCYILFQGSVASLQFTFGRGVAATSTSIFASSSEWSGRKPGRFARFASRAWAQKLLHWESGSKLQKLRVTCKNLAFIWDLCKEMQCKSTHYDHVQYRIPFGCV